MPVKIFGYYHHQNAGDEAFALFFRRVFRNTRVDFIADRSECPSIRRLIMGGGAIINEYFLAKLPEFDALDVIGCSLGGGEDKINLLMPISHKLGIIALRSPRDVEIARAKGLNAEYFPDIVFGLEKPHPTLSLASALRLGALPNNLSTEKKTAIVLLSDHYSTRYADEPSRFLAVERYKDALASDFDDLTCDYNLIFVPMSAFFNAMDYAFAHDVTRRMKRPELTALVSQYLGPEKVLNIIASIADVVVSMRYHGLVFGLLCEKPVINIGDEPKNIDLMKASSLERYSLPLDNLSEGSLAVAVRCSASMHERARLISAQHRAAVQPLIERLRAEYKPEGKSIISRFISKQF
jgi:polysaccharide pyruvyl transferase WcaK-like protein